MIRSPSSPSSARPPVAAGLARVAFALAAIALAALGGCATHGGAHVQRAATGEMVVRATTPMTFDEVAARAYGDASLGRTVARIAQRSYEDGVKRGDVLVLPVRDKLDARLAADASSDREYRRGLAAADDGRYRAAAGHFRAALQEAPHRDDVRYNLGLALMQAGELTEATELLEAAVKGSPNDAERRYAFGSLLRKRRAHRRAYEQFDAALRIDRTHANAAFARAKSLEDLERWDRAERAWRDFLDDFGDHGLAGSARRSLEEVLRRTGGAPLP